MLEILNYSIAFLDEAAVASGLPKNLDAPEVDGKTSAEGLKRLARLADSVVKTGVGGHDNALTGIAVSFDVRFPQYWLRQFERYHFAQIVSSQSLMHCVQKIRLSECVNEYADPEIVARVQTMIDAYAKEQTPENLMRVMSNMPMGVELIMQVCTNYKQLQTIWQQRRNHRLTDWREFCKWVEGLPYATELICKERPYAVPPGKIGDVTLKDVTEAEIWRIVEAVQTAHGEKFNLEAWSLECLGCEGEKNATDTAFRADARVYFSDQTISYPYGD